MALVRGCSYLVHDNGEGRAAGHQTKGVQEPGLYGMLLLTLTTMVCVQGGLWNITQYFKSMTDHDIHAVFMLMHFWTKLITGDQIISQVKWRCSIGVHNLTCYVLTIH